MNIIRDVTLQAQQGLASDEIFLFIGARQSGKTTILKQIQHSLEKAHEPCHFLNLEDPDYLALLNQSPKNLFKIMDIPLKKRAFIFIDEIQYLGNPTNFLKYFYDEYQGRLKLIVSGSSAFYVDQKFKDSLVGRKKIFNVHTLSLREFLRFKGEERLLKAMPEGFDVSHHTLKDQMALQDYERLASALEEFMIFGGYPRVALAETAEEKEMILQEIGYSYIKKDIHESGVRQEDVFFKLMKLLAAQTGGLVNANELANSLGVSKTAIDHYLHILQKSYHIALIKPFFKNMRKELTKMPKVFFRDLGLRNFFANNFQKVILRQDKGGLLENAAFRQFLERFPSDKINFWRTPQGHEVDFVVNGQWAFEAKWDASAIRTQKYKFWRKNYPGLPLNFIVYSKGQEKSNYSLWELWEL